MKKLIFLFLALLLPVLIYFFLKLFGKNEFEVPVLFADSVHVPVACNEYTYKAPYTVPDSVLQKISWNSQDSLTVIIMQDDKRDNRHERDIHVTRVLTEFRNESLHVIRIFKSEPVVNPGNGKITDISVSEEEFSAAHDCIFLLSSAADAVLIDRCKRIRGQYNLTSREDADRMIMQEMNILFKRY